MRGQGSVTMTMTLACSSSGQVQVTDRWEISPDSPLHRPNSAVCVCLVLPGSRTKPDSDGGAEGTHWMNAV